MRKVCDRSSVKAELPTIPESYMYSNLENRATKLSWLFDPGEVKARFKLSAHPLDLLTLLRREHALHHQLDSLCRDDELSCNQPFLNCNGVFMSPIWVPTMRQVVPIHVSVRELTEKQRNDPALYADE